nr:FAD-dependent oxidoreductase [Derxia gummosa]
MHVAVIGAGVVGVCTAHWLRAAGHDVTVIDRRANVAQETSFAPAAIAAPALAVPWSAPHMPGRWLRNWLRPHGPVVLRPGLSPANWLWLIRWLGESRARRFVANQERLRRLALLGREASLALIAEREIDSRDRAGCLRLFRSERALAAATAQLPVLADAGFIVEEASPERCREIEPALSDELPLAGGLSLPDARTGNVAWFTRQLKRALMADGVRFHFRAEVNELDVSGGRPRLRLRATPELQDPDLTWHPPSAPDTLEPDAVVLCTGTDSAGLLRRLGCSPGFVPVRGYSITLGIRRHERAPLAAVIDEATGVSITRMGNRMRVAGGVELGARRELSADGPVPEALWRVMRGWFGGAADLTCPQIWVGERALLPQGTPLLGATPHPAVFVNLAHGSHGWTVAAGAGQVLAELVSGRPAPIDLDGLTLASLRR